MNQTTATTRISCNFRIQIHDKIGTTEDKSERWFYLLDKKIQHNIYLLASNSVEHYGGWCVDTELDLVAKFQLTKLQAKSVQVIVQSGKHCSNWKTGVRTHFFWEKQKRITKVTHFWDHREDQIFISSGYSNLLQRHLISELVGF